MLKFDIERAKKVFGCDEEQYNEECLLNTLKDYLNYFMYHNTNLTTKQYHLIHDCWELACCIETTEANENRKEVN